ncbi:MAG: peptidase and in kexin sedolisin [Gemmatimonadetes bacterium]|nr:peptidase and in kexin sedolisin [Gemmatimonadota bacterium]
MAKSPRRRGSPGARTARGNEVDQDVGLGAPALGSQQLGSALTGRYLVLFDENDSEPGVRRLESVAGVSLSSSEAAPKRRTARPHDIVFDAINVGLVTMAPDQMHEFSVASLEAESGIVAMEPERILYALSDMRAGVLPDTAPLLEGAPGWTREYLAGYRDGVTSVIDHLLQSEGRQPTLFGESLADFDERAFTWGLQATGVSNSALTGRGISVAVLDTGLSLRHPDFAGRVLTAQSFVAGLTPDDRHGHGTHCIGTACGSAKPGQLPRYGVAYGAEIFAGRVLSDQGSGAEGDILNGLNWAITNGCVVVSMSLGASVSPNQPFNTVFEGAARRALAKGTLIVAAAGNDSRRPASTRPVSHPANCPSVMAVGSVSRKGAVSSFSNGGVNPNGGGVDIVGPGEDILSSYPSPLYRRLNGTSMATPHVAGIAALWAEKTGERGQQLWDRLIRSAKALPGAVSADVGAGLVQAP